MSQEVAEVSKNTEVTDITSLISLHPEISQPSLLNLSEKKEDELLKLFFDGNENIETRVLSLEELSKKNLAICYESINKITSMFSFSPNHIFRMLIKAVAKDSNMDLNIKTECARTLYDENKDTGYECFNHISSIMSTLPIPLQIDIVRTLMETMKYYNDTCGKLVSIITDKKLECEYRYKTIIGIQKDSSRKYNTSYVNEGYYCFFNHPDTFIRYKILAAQYLLQLSKKSNENPFRNENINSLVEVVEKSCIEFAIDSTLDYDLRADVADLLVRMGTSKSKEIGKEIITLLGRNPEGISTLYNNRQNVHDDEIDESIKKIVLYLASLRSEVNKEGKYVTFSDAQKEIEELANNYDKDIKINKPIRKDEESNDKKKSVMDCVKSSLLRISLDQTIYEGGQTLQSIFNKVWRLILSHEYVDILKTRMIEELIDMADTCSSGHISRIINVLCGFEIEGKTFSIEIGWKKQIQSNLIARLTKKIKDYPDEDVKEIILEEMSTSGNIINKPKLSEFFRNNLLPIRDELFEEFVGGKYISDEDFEEFFRSAIVFFEEG